jgi:cytochrome o ubiquinol oxidase subunit I
MKQHGFRRPTEGYVPIHMPRNTATGVIVSAIVTVLGFALIWHIWWLAGLTFVAAIACSIGHTFNYDRDFYIPAEEVREIEAARTPVRAELAE